MAIKAKKVISSKRPSEIRQRKETMSQSDYRKKKGTQDGSPIDLSSNRNKITTPEQTTAPKVDVISSSTKVVDPNSDLGKLTAGLKSGNAVMQNGASTALTAGAIPKAKVLNAAEKAVSNLNAVKGDEDEEGKKKPLIVNPALNKAMGYGAEFTDEYFDNLEDGDIADMDPREMTPAQLSKRTLYSFRAQAGSNFYMSDTDGEDGTKYDSDSIYDYNADKEMDQSRAVWMNNFYQTAREEDYLEAIQMFDAEIEAAKDSPYDKYRLETMRDDILRHGLNAKHQGVLDYEREHAANALSAAQELYGEGEAQDQGVDIRTAQDALNRFGDTEDIISAFNGEIEGYDLSGLIGSGVDYDTIIEDATDGSGQVDTEKLSILLTNALYQYVQNADNPDIQAEPVYDSRSDDMRKAQSAFDKTTVMLDNYQKVFDAAAGADRYTDMYRTGNEGMFDAIADEYTQYGYQPQYGNITTAYDKNGMPSFHQEQPTIADAVFDPQGVKDFFTDSSNVKDGEFRRTAELKDIAEFTPYMTDDEKRMFAYLEQTFPGTGESEKYLNDLKNGYLGERRDYAKQLEMYYQTNGMNGEENTGLQDFWQAVKNTGLLVEKGAETLLTPFVMASIFGMKLRGEDVSAYDTIFDLNKRQNNIVSGVSQHADKIMPWDMPDWLGGGKVGSVVVGNLSSMIDNGIQAATMNGFGGVLGLTGDALTNMIKTGTLFVMGNQVATQTLLAGYQDPTKSEAQIWGDAGAATFAELASETFLSLDPVAEPLMSQGIGDRTFKQWFKDLMVSGAVEGVEEVTSDMLNLAYAYIEYGESDYTDIYNKMLADTKGDTKTALLKTIGYVAGNAAMSFAGGFASTTGSSLTGAAKSAVANRVNDVSIGNAILSHGTEAYGEYLNSVMRASDPSGRNYKWAAKELEKLKEQGFGTVAQTTDETQTGNAEGIEIAGQQAEAEAQIEAEAQAEDEAQEGYAQPQTEELVGFIRESEEAGDTKEDIVNALMSLAEENPDEYSPEAVEEAVRAVYGQEQTEESVEETAPVAEEVAAAEADAQEETPVEEATSEETAEEAVEAEAETEAEPQADEEAEAEPMSERDTEREIADTKRKIAKAQKEIYKLAKKAAKATTEFAKQGIKDQIDILKNKVAVMEQKNRTLEAKQGESAEVRRSVREDAVEAETETVTAETAAEETAAEETEAAVDTEAQTETDEVQEAEAETETAEQKKDFDLDKWVKENRKNAAKIGRIYRKTVKALIGDVKKIISDENMAKIKEMLESDTQEEVPEEIVSDLLDIANDEFTDDQVDLVSAWVSTHKGSVVSGIMTDIVNSEGKFATTAYSEKAVTTAKKYRDLYLSAYKTGSMERMSAAAQMNGLVYDLAGATSVKAVPGVQKTNADGVTSVASTDGKTQEIKGIPERIKTEGGRLVAEVDIGGEAATVDIESIEGANDSETALLRSISMYSGGDGTVATAIRSGGMAYNVGTMSQYAGIVQKAQRYGFMGANEGYMMNRIGTGIEAVDNALKAVRNKASESRTKINENQRSRAKGKPGEGKVDTSGIKGVKLNRYQKNAVSILGQFAKTGAVNISLVSTEANENGKYGDNGSYDPNTNTITIDINAGIDTVEDSKALAGHLIAKVFSHELTHYVQSNNAQGYQVLMDTLAEAYGKSGTTFEALVTNKYNSLVSYYFKNGVERTEAQLMAEATDEVIADACEAMLKDSKVSEYVANQVAEQNVGLAKKIRDFIARFIDRIKKAFAGYSEANGTREAFALAGLDVKTLENIQKVWDDAVIEAMKSAVGNTETFTAAMTEAEGIVEAVDNADVSTLTEQQDNLVESDTETETVEKTDTVQEETTEAETETKTEEEGGTIRDRALPEMKPVSKAASDIRSVTIDGTTYAVPKITRAYDGTHIDMRGAEVDMNDTPFFNDFREFRPLARFAATEIIGDSYNRVGASSYMAQSDHAGAVGGVAPVRTRAVQSDIYSWITVRQQYSKKTGEPLKLKGGGKFGWGGYEWTAKKIESVMNKFIECIDKDTDIPQTKDMLQAETIIDTVLSYGFQHVDYAVRPCREYVMAKAQIEGTLHHGIGQNQFTVTTGEDFWTYNFGTDRVEMFGTKYSPADIMEMISLDMLDEENLRSIIRQAGFGDELEAQSDIELEKGDLAAIAEDILKQQTELLEAEDMQDASLGYRVFDEKDIGMREAEAEILKSIRVSSDGIRYIELDVDQHLFDGQTPSELRNTARQVIKKRFAGKVVGSAFSFFVNGASANEYSHPSKRISGNDSFEAKMRLSTEIDNLPDVGLYYWDEADGRDGHVHKNAKDGFTYFDVIFKMGKQFFVGRVNIMNTEYGRLFKDLTKIEGIDSDELIGSNGEILLSNFVRNAFNNHILSGRDIRVNIKEDSLTKNTSDAEIRKSSNELSDIAKEIKAEKRFSMRKEVERVGNLIAVHNIYSQHIMQQIREGGFPAPSIAVIKAGSRHHRYGDVSVVFKSSAIDPKANKNNKIYGTDVYTPTRSDADIGYGLADYSSVSEVSDKMKELSKRIPSAFKNGAYSFLHGDLFTNYTGYTSDSVEDTIRSIKYGQRNDALKAMYLTDIGETVEPVMVEEKPDFKEDHIDFYEGLIDLIGYEKIFDNTAFSLIDEYYDEIMKMIDDLIAAGKLPTSRARLKKLPRYRAANVLDNIFNQATEYYNAKNGNIQYGMVEDQSATIDSVRERVSDNDEGYNKWLTDIVKSLYSGDVGVRNDNEIFTRAGKRRSYDQLFGAYSLENIVKSMFRNGSKGAQTHSEGTIYIEAAKEYNSLDAVRSDESRLQTYDQETYDEMVDAVLETYNKVCENIASDIGDDVYAVMGSVESAAKKNSKTKSGFTKALSAERVYVSETTLNDLWAVITEAQNIPTEYFEAKPERVINLDEIEAIVVPKTENEAGDVSYGELTEDDINEISNMGINVVTYESDNEDSRANALNDIPEARFSRRGDGLTNSQLLQMASDAVAQTEEEKKYLNEYRDAVGRLAYLANEYDKYERRLQGFENRTDVSEADREWVEQEISKNKARLESLETQIDSALEKTAKLESTKPLRNVMAQIREDTEAAVADALKDVRDLSKENVKKALDKQKEKYKEQIKELRAKLKANNSKETQRKIDSLERRLDALKQKYTESMANEAVKRKDALNRMRDQRASAETRRKIRRIIDDFNSRLAKPNANRYIPVDMVRGIIDAMESFDLSYTRNGEEKVSAKIAEMQGVYEKYKNDSTYQYAYDPVIADMIASLQKTMGDTRFNRLTKEQLDAVYTTVKALHKTLTEATKLKAGNYARDIFHAVQNMITETDEAAPIATGRVGEYLNWQLTPMRFFRRIAGYAKNSTWEHVGRTFLKAEERYYEVQRQAQEFFQEFAEKKEFEALTKHGKDDLVDIGLTNMQTGEAVKVTRGMMLSMYMHLQNEDNRGGILRGGLTVPGFKDYYNGKQKRAFSTEQQRTAGTSQRLAEIREQMFRDGVFDADVLSAEQENLMEAANDEMDIMQANIEGMMTEFEKKLCEAVHEWNDRISRDMLNEVTLDLYGFKKAEVENYFPIHRDTDFIEGNFESIKRDYNLENAGFMKDRVQSSAPMMLTDIVYEMSGSINGVARYVGYVRAQRDFNKMYNGKLPGMTKSVKNSVAKKFGAGTQAAGVTGAQYIENLMQDITGSRARSEDSIFAAIRRNMPRATLSANIRVALSQLASIPTAAAAMDIYSVAKGTFEGLNTAFSTKQKNELAEKSVWFWQRYRGEGGMAEIGDMKSGGNIIDRAYNKLNRVTKGLIFNWCQNFDVAATSMMYKMAENWVETHTDLHRGTDEFAQAVDEKYTEVLTETQPMYTTTARSDIMRGTNEIMKMFTMYKTQANQNLNILYDAAANFRKMSKDIKTGANGVNQEDVAKARTKLANSIVSVGIVAPITYAVLRFVGNALMMAFKKYKDQDDDITLMSITNGITQEAVSSIASIPVFGSDLYDLVYSRLTGSKYYGIDDSAIGKIGEILDTLGNEDLTDIDTLKGFGGDIAMTLGIPVDNVLKYVDAVGGYIEAMKEGDLFAGVYSDKTYYGRMFNAALKGNDDAFADAVIELGQSGKPQDDIDKGLAKVVGEKFVKGKISGEEAARILMDYAGMDKGKVNREIDKWEYKIENGTEKGYSRYEALNDSIVSEDLDAAIDEMNRLLDEGEEIRNIRTNLSSKYNDGTATNLTNLMLRADSLNKSNKDTYDELVMAIVSGSGIEEAVNNLKANRVKTKQIMGAIDSSFGKNDVYYNMWAFNPEQSKVLLNRVLDAYEAIGLDRQEETEWIKENWLYLDRHGNDTKTKR